VKFGVRNLARRHVSVKRRHEPWEVVHSIVLMPALDQIPHVVYEDPLFRFSPVIVNVNSADPAVAVVGAVIEMSLWVGVGVTRHLAYRHVPPR